MMLTMQLPCSQSWKVNQTVIQSGYFDCWLSEAAERPLICRLNITVWLWYLVCWKREDRESDREEGKCLELGSVRNMFLFFTPDLHYIWIHIILSFNRLAMQTYRPLINVSILYLPYLYVCCVSIKRTAGRTYSVFLSNSRLIAPSVTVCHSHGWVGLDLSQGRC